MAPLSKVIVHEVVSRVEAQPSMAACSLAVQSLFSAHVAGTLKRMSEVALAVTEAVGAVGGNGSGAGAHRPDIGARCAGGMGACAQNRMQGNCVGFSGVG